MFIYVRINAINIYGDTRVRFIDFAFTLVTMIAIILLAIIMLAIILV